MVGTAQVRLCPPYNAPAAAKNASGPSSSTSRLPFDQPETICRPRARNCGRATPAGSSPDGQQFVLQRFLPLDIEMVGRLIQQIEVRLGEPQQQHAEPRLLSAGKSVRSDGSASRSICPAPASNVRARWSPTSKRRVIVRIGVSASPKVGQRLIAIAEHERLRRLDSRLRRLRVVRSPRAAWRRAASCRRRSAPAARCGRPCR